VKLSTQTFAIAWGIAAPILVLVYNDVQSAIEDIPGNAFPPLPPLAPEAVPIKRLTREVRFVDFACTEERKDRATRTREQQSVMIQNKRLLIAISATVVTYTKVSGPWGICVMRRSV